MQQADPHAPHDEALHRLFFALWPDDALRERIADTAAQLECKHAPGGRRLRSERYHLTLQFLGYFQSLRPSVVNAARAAAATVRPPAFELVFDHAGSFSGSRVSWLGMHGIPPGLQALWDALRAALAEAGVQVKSAPAFAPHLTIRRDVRRQTAPIAIQQLRWPVREFVLIDSVPSARAPYCILGRWPLMPT
jgi:2'-5' RNA ligase